MSFRLLRLLLVLPFALACAAEGARTPIDVDGKAEALEGERCFADGDCDRGEFCDLRLCIPEGPPCPTEGECRAQTRFYDNEGTEIPDAYPDGVERPLVVDRPPSSVARAFIALTIRHTWIGDLRVVLRSPDGVEHVLHDREGGSADDLVITRDVTEAFEGGAADGVWTLRVSDHARQDVGRLVTWRLQLEYASAGEPHDPSTDVWATVELPSTESAHPYANDTDETTDLRRFSGGASRARIRFDRIDVERGYDRVDVVDIDTGAVLDTFTGRLDAFTTREYETGNLGVRLVSDYIVTGWGFRVAAVEVFGKGCLEDADCPAGTQCPTEVIRCITWPCFASCQPIALGGEGDPCAASAECDEGLYCGADARCRGIGTCSELADCNDPDNSYVHILCVGTATCEAGSCGWRCDTTPICVEGDTRDDGCNTCTCSGGFWACTERYCPPVVGAGETCGAGVICDSGLVCDRGPTDGASCTSDHLGVCVSEPEGPRFCRGLYAPVCGCNGQTFDGNCERSGMADWAHAGECALDLAIPDADAEGISTSIIVQRPAASHRAEVEVRIEHTWRSDLVVWVEAPDGSRHLLTNREGGSADDFEDAIVVDLGDAPVVGQWTLHVSDHARWDTGVLRFFNVSPR